MNEVRPGAGSSRTVVVFRHAHAVSDASGGDRGRDLDARGRREATSAGQWLAGLDLGIELVLCSTATRAEQTWSAASRAFADPPRVTMTPSIYDGGVDDLLQLINDASAHTLVLVGHNPTVSALVAELDPDFHRQMRPAAVAVVELADESGAAGGRVTAFWTPER